MFEWFKNFFGLAGDIGGLAYLSRLATIVHTVFSIAKSGKNPAAADEVRDLFKNTDVSAFQRLFNKLDDTEKKRLDEGTATAHGYVGGYLRTLKSEGPNQYNDLLLHIVQTGDDNHDQDGVDVLKELASAADYEKFKRIAISRGLMKPTEDEYPLAILKKYAKEALTGLATFAEYFHNTVRNGLRIVVTGMLAHFLILLVVCWLSSTYLFFTFLVWFGAIWIFLAFLFLLFAGMKWWIVDYILLFGWINNRPVEFLEKSWAYWRKEETANTATSTTTSEKKTTAKRSLIYSPLLMFFLFEILIVEFFWVFPVFVSSTIVLMLFMVGIAYVISRNLAGAPPFDWNVIAKIQIGMAALCILLICWKWFLQDWYNKSALWLQNNGEIVKIVAVVLAIIGVLWLLDKTGLLKIGDIRKLAAVAALLLAFYIWGWPWLKSLDRPSSTVRASMQAAQAQQIPTEPSAQSSPCPEAGVIAHTSRSYIEAVCLPPNKFVAVKKEVRAGQFMKIYKETDSDPKTCPITVSQGDMVESLEHTSVYQPLEAEAIKGGVIGLVSPNQGCSVPHVIHVEISR